ncbi:MAG TPA: M1 family metallopeptidase [Geminicoccus sp.]|jgi:aminopeptidase N|uniref:M1 family metallopeptidase n=1 Tax=Geminicoccus sp. TaxID=2024832 RepID=UPI002E363A0D|nr:M1 family metallopeptidase [Geminicoccus sp.]HEX2527738.1 M1 family metallopeptidase [Geminicoccus sp.]
MRSFIAGAGMALAAMVASGPASAIDEFFPTFGNDGYDVIHYDLDLDVSVAPHHLDGYAKLLARAEQRLSRMTLDLAGLDVSSVRVDGVRASFSQANDKLTIVPKAPIAKGRKFVVAIAYDGTPVPIQDPTAPGDPDYLLGWFKYQNSTYALSEPVGASTFYPANDEPTDKASFTFDITVPADYTAVANGVLVRKDSLRDKRRFVWLMRDPMTTWLATVHVNKFKLTTARTKDGIPLRFYTTAATPAEDIAGYAESREMIPYLEKLIGRYPFDGYGSVVVDDPALYYALETQAMSTFPVGAADEAIVAHELAHQWFGNSVSVAQWRDLWIAEGAATYFETLWPNRSNRAAFEAEMAALYAYAQRVKLGPAVVERPDQIFSNRTYVRGALALHALELKVGQKTFYKVLRTFLQKYRDGNATSRNFIDTAVSVSRTSGVRSLLNDWLYEQALPSLPSQTMAAAAQRSGPVPVPDIVGLRCEGGAHRSSGLDHCVAAAAP